MRAKRGSALLMALVTIAVLSVLVMSFIYEARQQAGINFWVRERNRLYRVMDSGRYLAEVVLTGFSEAPDWSEDLEVDKMKAEDDRWIVEKMDLKTNSKCTIGPILLDDARNDNGDLENPVTITVEIQSVNSGEKGVININELYKGGGDSTYNERWWMIFLSHNIPEELDTPDEGRINLWNMLIASWDDWRDDDDTVSSIDGEDCGAEREYYEKEDEDNDIDEEDRRRPRNGRIPDIRELSYVRGFRDYPQVLTGGVINPWENDKDNQITVRGIEDLFCTEGSSKININSCHSIDALITIPGIFEEPDKDEACEEARNVATLILAGLNVKPENRDVDESRDWWPYKDWSDLTERVDEDIGNAASKYLSFQTDGNTVFKVRIIGECGGMTREVNAECYVKDKKVRYTRWRED